MTSESLIAEFAPKITAPVLVAAGDADREVDAAGVDELTRSLNKGRAQMISGHITFRSSMILIRTWHFFLDTKPPPNGRGKTRTTGPKAGCCKRSRHPRWAPGFQRRRRRRVASVRRAMATTSLRRSFNGASEVSEVKSNSVASASSTALTLTPSWAANVCHSSWASSLR